MAKTTRRMLIDATHSEETRVAVIDQHLRLEHLDIVHAGREPLKGNIYLAKVKRIEPSLQAAFVEYGGNRHGFLPFAEIHPDYFRIPTTDREALMQKIAAAEERLLAKVESGTNVRKALAEEGIGEEALTEPMSAEDAADVADLGDAADPLQTIALDGDNDTGLVKLLDDAPAVSTADIDAAAEPQIDLGADDGDEDEGDEELAADDGAAAPAEKKAEGRSNYDTMGGGEDDMMELRQRIRRQFLRNYRIQEVIKRGQVMLIQVVKEERGNKGAALTTYMSLAGRYCVLMPNSDRSGGVSRKISNPGDRRRLKQIIDSLEVPAGMSCILRTAGVERTDEEIKRDFDYLVRLWDQIRDQTLQSTAPAVIYEEANLIKRALRDYYTRDTDSIIVEGEEGYKLASDFMKLLMPNHAERVINYTDSNVSLFTRYQIEAQIEKLYQPVVQLKSGGYIVINPTEALVSIDVNSGRATRDRHIEETALRTNMEASEEIARQLRLRDLAGLVVIDFIDMEDYKHNHQVERRLKDAMRHDRARLQIGRISPFGLLEMSRQRLRASLLETNYEKCPHCQGTGHVRSTDSAALSVLRAIADEGIKQKAAELAVYVPTAIAIYILNHKRAVLEDLQRRYGLVVYLKNDDELSVSEFKLERLTGRDGESIMKMPTFDPNRVFFDHANELGIPPLSSDDMSDAPDAPVGADEEEGGEGRRERGNRNRRERGGRNRRGKEGREGRGNKEERKPREPKEVAASTEGAEQSAQEADGNVAPDGSMSQNGERKDGDRKRRRRGRRGGRNRGERGERQPRDPNAPANNDAPSHGNGNVAASGPSSVYDIDTTPKQHGQDAGDGEQKAGWWRRWTS